MTLQEAIELVIRVTPESNPWTGSDLCEDDNDLPSDVDIAIATILNAVVKGELK